MPPFDIIRPPDHAIVWNDHATFHLRVTGEEGFVGHGVRLTAEPVNGALQLLLQSDVPLMHLQLRWSERIPEGLRYLGDAWESGYGNLEWRGMVPDRPMPWYFLAYDGQHTHGVGVRTGAAALCHWHVDPYGVNLWLDVTCGGSPVQLGDRELRLAEIVVRPGKVWEIPFQSARRFAVLLEEDHLLPEHPVYGFISGRDASDGYGAQTILRDGQVLTDLADNTVNRPFLVVDCGWQQGGPMQGTADMRANPSFGDMKSLAQAISAMGCRPGLWIRPLLSSNPDHKSWAFHNGRFYNQPLGWVLDPTHPAAIDLIQQDVQRAAEWGFELIRFDYTTFDLLGSWEPQLDHVADLGWQFHNISMTTAEVIVHLYRTLRKAAGTSILLSGVNTIGHLAAGHVHLNRIGDDICDHDWDRVCTAGINALAFRGFHHGALYATDADSVCLTPEIPWVLSRQWLQLLSTSGTTCFVAPMVNDLNEVQQQALHNAFSMASRQNAVAEPLDWLTTSCPGRWHLGSETAEFDWFSGLYNQEGL